jgi:rubredoxin
MAAMKCKMCGWEMNHHGDKVIYGERAEGVLVEQIAEAHTCPNCGYNDSRMAGQ